MNDYLVSIGIYNISYGDECFPANELLCDDKHFTVFETFKKSFELVFVSPHYSFLNVEILSTFWWKDGFYT